jgi:aryl-alcohol dehydrogenase-like predicted oxidoreductase
VQARADYQHSLYGDNEELLAKWFRRTGKRDEVFLATKFGFVKGSKTLEIDSSYDYCKKACAESLETLGIDSIDLCNYSMSQLAQYCRAVRIHGVPSSSSSH